MSSELCKLALEDLITEIQLARENQEAMDQVYEKLCETILTQMKQNIPMYGSTNKTSRRFKCRKPYWNDDLQNSWNTMRVSENKMIKFHGCRREKSRLHADYIVARNSFDKLLRQHERAHRRLQALNLEEMNTSNPNEFWRTIQKMGPRKNRDIPIEIVDDQGNICTDENVVFNKWKSEFYKLYNSDEEADFNDIHYDRSKIHKTLLENNMNDPLFEPNPDLNYNLTLEEVASVVQKSKSGSAYGFDEIPYDVLKSPVIIAALQQLFQFVFDSGIIPSKWRKAIIYPLLKDPCSDKRVPMNYRGISLLSCISKLYSSVLNKRLMTYLEDNNILADEQNGFRRQRSCEDHVFTLNSVIRNNSSVFTAFIDLRRCFDYIDRDMLLYKLLLNKIDGKFYNSIKNIYASSISCIRINNKLTDWFNCSTGVKQGCTLSPTLYSVFANDLIEEVNNLDLGVQVGDRKLSLLAYADDVCLVARSEEDLQTMLDTVHEWCKRWRILINTDKSKCIHFRKGRTQRSDHQFTIGGNTLETVDKYKYLGVIFHEKNDFSHHCEAIGKGAGRALGSIISKIHKFKDFGFQSYEKLYKSCVTPILDYCASVWGFKKYQCIDNVQNRAMRYFLGVHRFTPVLALTGDTGWIPSVYRRWGAMLRLWNRLILMDDSRITKQVFEKDYELCQNNWSQDVMQVMSILGLSEKFDSKSVIDLSNASSVIHEHYANVWRHDVQRLQKLRTYRLFKTNFECESYVKLNLCKNERSLLCQFRSGILPLRIETGRYIGEPSDQRLCRFCDSNSVEDELHFLRNCEFYSNLRTESQFCEIFTNSLNDPAEQWLSALMSGSPRKLAKYLVKAYIIRRNSVFN